MGGRRGSREGGRRRDNEERNSIWERNLHLLVDSSIGDRSSRRMFNLHDRIKDGITCAYKFFSQFSKSLENRSSCNRSSKLERKMSHRTFLTYRKNARSDGAISIVEKKGGKELICSLRRGDGVSQRGLRKGLKSRPAPTRSSGSIGTTSIVLPRGGLIDICASRCVPPPSASSPVSHAAMCGR